MKANRWTGLSVSLYFLVVLGIHPAEADGLRRVVSRGKPATLMGDALQVGKALPEAVLPDNSLTLVDLKSLRGKVTIVSVVPSLDTPTCEKQTHILSEENGGLDRTANLVTISRDLPFAQKRFSKEAKIGNVLFLSDYRDASFGKAAGLSIEENRLLARAIIVLDKEGVVRYLEAVPDLGQLPKMKEAFDFAKSL
ncbi:MAG: thiol peroxidase [Nitrospinae bacterium]|nr:thiol peroxidase [Nitrospinota bacterium]